MKRIFRPGEMLSNTICTNEPGLLDSFGDALRAEIFQKTNSNFSNYFEQQWIMTQRRKQHHDTEAKATS